jgi:hypothetical protein
MLRVPLPASFPVAAGLAWIAAAWTTVRYLRRRGDARLWAHWCTVVLLALSLTVAVPAVYLAVDRFLGLPNAACWITNALALGSAYMVDTFFFALAHGSDQLRWHRPWLLGYLALTLATMAVLLWRVGLRVDVVPLDLPQVNPALVAFRLVFLAFLGFIVVRVIANAAYYRRLTPDPLVQVGMSLLLVGGLWGLSYLVSRLATVLLPNTSRLAQPLNLWLEFSVLMGILCLALGTLVPQWGKRLGVPAIAQHVSVMLAYWRLRALWRRLSQARPEVILPTAVSWRSALWRPPDMDFLLQRRVIEILDARRLLLTAAPATSSRPLASSPSSGVSTTQLWSGSGGPEGSRPVLAPSAASSAVHEWSAMPHGAPHMAEAAGDALQQAQQAPKGQREETLNWMARMEAWLLASRLRAFERTAGRTSGRASAGSLLAPAPGLFQPATYAESVDYLQRVARAWRKYGGHNARARASGQGRDIGEEWSGGETRDA